MKESLKALWNKIPSLKQVGLPLDSKLGFIPGMKSSETTTIVSQPTYRKPQEKSLLKELFRSDKRLRLEKYVGASTQAEQDVCIAEMEKHGDI